MEGGGSGRGGGGGGRTPRGKKFRGGNQRGRGQASPSPSQQSPSVSSSTATPATSTPLARGSRNDEPKITISESISDLTSSTVVQPPVQPTTEPTVPKSSTKTTEKMEETESTGAVASAVESKDDIDKKAESPPESVGETAPVAVPIPRKQTPPPIIQPSPASCKEDLELEEPPSPPPSSKTHRTESKVETQIGSQQPRATAKTLVVSPPPKETGKTSDAPLSVEIDPAVIPPSGTQPPPPRRSSRSGSLSPGYALYGPVGKPGYIGGVGFSEMEGEGDAGGHSPGGRPGIVRRESAFAAMESAVKGFTKRQWILLVMFGLVDMLSAITISLQAPFYPAEAEKKGATPTEYGFVFGIFEFIVFLTSPIFGKYMNKLGPKTVFSVCLLITSISVICFGLLDRIDDHTWFISLCFVCRIFEALGCAGFFTATFVIIACEFPETVATTFASLETFFGLGLILGPSCGGALYGVGGFPLPFFVVGACLLVTGLIAGLVMPKIDKHTDEDGVEEEGYGVLTILRFPSVALAAISIAATSTSLGFISATLEPHIRRFGLTPLQTGLVFICNGGMYALTAPFWGYICDYISRPIYITIIGNLLIFLSFIIIGPADFIPFDTILWVTIVGLLIQGLGFGACLVSGFIVALKDSMKHGLPDNMATYGVSSGLWTSSISLGACIGPIVGGIFYDLVGFRDGSWFILATSLVVGISILIHTCCTSADKLQAEMEPLLRPISPLLGKKEGLESKSTYGTASGGDGAV